ncbi:MAG TPA: hypothetical protein VM056_02790 [Terriglobales bacterium]|nr:hypothetical protein [Terriglobales bacterium]
MAVVVVGGHSRNVGKTSVVAGLIAALPTLHWTAVKITQFGHGMCSVSAEPCECALNEIEHSWSIDDETDRSGESDTSRFLLAGARRSIWVRTKQGMLAEAMPALRAKLENAGNVIIESNSVIKFLRPDIYLTVLNMKNPDFKDSAREFFDRADGVVMHDDTGAPAWDDVSLKLISGKPIFRIEPPEYVIPEMVKFVVEKIGR